MWRASVLFYHNFSKWKKQNQNLILTQVILNANFSKNGKVSIIFGHTGWQNISAWNPTHLELLTPIWNAESTHLDRGFVYLQMLVIFHKVYSKRA
jgi:hypothetical protein